MARCYRFGDLVDAGLLCFGDLMEILDLLILLGNTGILLAPYDPTWETLFGPGLDRLYEAVLDCLETLLLS
jgi:hypothetical protein